MCKVTMPHCYLKNSLSYAYSGHKFKNVILSIILFPDAVTTIKFSNFFLT